MGNAPKILAFAGSSREGSFNKKLIAIAADGARAVGAEVTLIDLRDFPLPIFDEDLEKQGTPANVGRLKELFESHQGLMISSPEYNSSVTALLKNTLDWVSRPVPGKGPLAGIAGKAAVLMSASPGALGGLRGLVHLRSILGNIGVLLLPDQLAIMRAHEAFGADGALKDAGQQKAAQGLGAKLAELLKKLG